MRRPDLEADGRARVRLRGRDRQPRLVEHLVDREESGHLTRHRPRLLRQDRVATVEQPGDLPEPGSHEEAPTEAVVEDEQETLDGVAKLIRGLVLDDEEVGVEVLLRDRDEHLHLLGRGGVERLERCTRQQVVVERLELDREGLEDPLGREDRRLGEGEVRLTQAAANVHGSRGEHPDRREPAELGVDAIEGELLSVEVGDVRGELLQPRLPQRPVAAPRQQGRRPSDVAALARDRVDVDERILRPRGEAQQADRNAAGLPRKRTLGGLLLSEQRVGDLVAPRPRRDPSGKRHRIQTDATAVDELLVGECDGLGIDLARVVRVVLSGALHDDRAKLDDQRLGRRRVVVEHVGQPARLVLLRCARHPHQRGGNLHRMRNADVLPADRDADPRRNVQDGLLSRALHGGLEPDHHPRQRALACRRNVPFAVVLVDVERPLCDGSPGHVTRASSPALRLVVGLVTPGGDRRVDGEGSLTELGIRDRLGDRRHGYSPIMVL